MIEIIAEIGKNFVDTKEEQPIPVLIEKAKKLILEAKKAGADTAKFQAHNYLDEVHPTSERYEWTKRNTYPSEFWLELKEYCHKVGINFLCTPMSRGAAYLIEGVSDRWKVGSGDVTDFVLLDYIRDYHKPIILSSGMSSIQELRKAYDFIREKTKDVMIMHCVSNYPSQVEDLNLRTIPFLKKEFPEAQIGFSDHSVESIFSALWAIRAGAEIIEHHFTLDKNAFGPDHKVSYEPHEFALMTKMIREEWVSDIPKEGQGVETKFINEEEMKFRKIFRKGLYAGRDIKKGELIAREDILALRPRGNAPKSEDFELYLDKVAEHDYQQYDPL